MRKPICGWRSRTSRSGIGQRAGLAQDLLRDGELAEVVQAAGETRELDLLGVESQALRDLGGQFADPLGVTPGVRVAGVDRFREATRRRGNARPCRARLRAA